MSGLSIILCIIVGNSLVGNGAYPAPFIKFICSILMIFLPFFYAWGVIYLIKLIIEKETNSEKTVTTLVILFMTYSIAVHGQNDTWSSYSIIGDANGTNKRKIE